MTPRYVFAAGCSLLVAAVAIAQPARLAPPDPLADRLVAEAISERAGDRRSARGARGSATPRRPGADTGRSERFACLSE